ncbi:hypothetical protein WA158_002004 [Blastocystis sp. Blastoise]
MFTAFRGIRSSILPLKRIQPSARFFMVAKNGNVVNNLPKNLFASSKLATKKMNLPFVSNNFKRLFSEAAEEATQEAARSNVPMVVSVVRTTKKATKSVLWLGLTVVICSCAYLIGVYLWPSPISPQRIFNDAFSVVRENEKINQMLGGNLKAYGIEMDSKVEGRRNMIDSISFVGDDGVPRCRIVFNVEGRNGKGIVYAEKSKEMAKGQFYYLVFVQPTTNRVLGIVDNREYIEKTKLQEQVVKQLKEHRAYMYGHRGYKVTFDQLNEFGDHAGEINLIDCAQKEQLCAQLQIQMVPTWIIDGVKYRGLIHLEDFDAVIHPPAVVPGPFDQIKEYWQKLRGKSLKVDNKKETN